MRPYYERDGIRIYCANCLEILPDLEAGSVDLVLTSPPYNVGLKYDCHDDRMADDAFKDLNSAWLRLTRPLAKETGRLCAVVSDGMLWWLRPLAEEAGWNWGELLVWCKPNMAGGARITGDWNHLAEWILWLRADKRTPMVNGHGNTHNWFVIPSPQSQWNGDKRKLHPAQWPIDLPRRLMSRTPGSLMLDPFMGAGTGLLAAKSLGWCAIGCDVSERYCEIAAKRLEQDILPLVNASLN